MLKLHNTSELRGRPSILFPRDFRSINCNDCWFVQSNRSTPFPFQSALLVPSWVFLFSFFEHRPRKEPQSEGRGGEGDGGELRALFVQPLQLPLKLQACLDGLVGLSKSNLNLNTQYICVFQWPEFVACGTKLTIERWNATCVNSSSFYKIDGNGCTFSLMSTPFLCAAIIIALKAANLFGRAHGVLRKQSELKYIISFVF